MHFQLLLVSITHSKCCRFSKEEAVTAWGLRRPKSKLRPQCQAPPPRPSDRSFGGSESLCPSARVFTETVANRKWRGSLNSAPSLAPKDTGHVQRIQSRNADPLRRGGRDKTLPGRDQASAGSAPPGIQPPSILRRISGPAPGLTVRRRNSLRTRKRIPRKG